MKRWKIASWLAFGALLGVVLSYFALVTLLRGKPWR